MRNFSPTTSVAMFAVAGFLAASSVYAAPSLSRSNVTIGLGQSITIIAQGSASVYMASNSDSSVASVSFSGTQVVVTGTQIGSTNASICSVGSANDCTGLNINVQGASVPVLTFSPNNISLTAGQSASVTVSGATGSYTLVSNSNTSGVQVSLTSSTVSISAIGSSGISAITVCSASDSNLCGTLVVNLGSTSVSNSGGAVSFSQNNISLSPGTSQSVTVNGGGTYNISSNSNAGVASASLSGSTLAIIAIVGGNANINVCNQSGSCAVLYVTVSAGGSSTSGASLTFDNANPSIAVAQIFNVNISGGTGYYVSRNTNPSVASWTFNGNTISVSGLTVGTAVITVCSSANACGSINVTVGGGSSASSSSSGSISSAAVVFGTANPSITVSQSMNISISGGSGFFVSSNPSPGIVQATINGNSLSLSGLSVGSDMLTVCASAGGCSTINVTVASQTVSSPVSTSPVSTQGASQSNILAVIQSMQSQLAQILAQIQSMANTLTQLAASATSNAATIGNSANKNTNSFIFTQTLGVGSDGDEVTALQNRLTADGFYSGPITGKFGALTRSAVIKYQNAKNLTPTGSVGSATRAVLNGGV